MFFFNFKVKTLTNRNLKKIVFFPNYLTRSFGYVQCKTKNKKKTK